MKRTRYTEEQFLLALMKGDAGHRIAGSLSPGWGRSRVRKLYSWDRYRI
jgi:hypothetical protein